MIRLLVLIVLAAWLLGMLAGYGLALWMGRKKNSQ